MIITIVSFFPIMKNIQEDTMENFTTGALNLNLALQKPVPKDSGLKKARDQSPIDKGSPICWGRANSSVCYLKFSWYSDPKGLGWPLRNFKEMDSD